MSGFQDVFTKLVLKRERSVKDICAPLVDCLGIPIFAYGSIESDGRYVNLTNYPKIEEEYYAQQLYLDDPHVSHPLLLRSGTISIPVTYNPEYMQKILKQSQVGQLLLILQCSEQRVEAFFFGLKSDESNAHTRLFNCFDLLQRFTRYFKREAAPIIERARREQFNAREVKGKVFTEAVLSTPLANKDPQIQRFLKMMTPLTAREMQCLELFKEGKTAQMTGAILGLSQRTVEYYFDNIKNKLGCSSKTDLLTW